VRNLNELNHLRDFDFEMRVYGVNGNEGNGVFRLLSMEDNKTLAIIVSDGGGWDHVSVSRGDRTPNYTEMEQVASLFFKEDETAVQYHVPKGEHVNIHPYCLHWWRPTEETLPKPPSSMVGPKK
jgi:hypothetical protein